MRIQVLVAVLAAVSAEEVLAERSPGEKFSIAIEYGDLAAVKALVEGGQSPDTPIMLSEYRTTPLIEAAEDGRTEIVRYLISKGADVNGKGIGGKTPLVAALTYDDVVELLLKAGADVKATNDQGSTAFHTAIYAGRLDAAEQLLQAGSDIEAKDTLGFTPLMTAANFCSPDALRFLASKGAKIDAMGKLQYGGATALTVASGDGAVECVRTLLELGANPALKMKDGATALSKAQEAGRAEVVALIKEALAKAPARKPARAARKP